MDLNELLYQQQRAVAGARHPGDHRTGSRFDLVGYYGRRIRDLQIGLGVSHRPVWLGTGAGL